MGILNKFKVQSSKFKVGFTLIELLVVMSVFGIVSAALVGIFLRSIKGGGKADAIAEVKENGDYALGVMERVLRNAVEIKSCTGNKIEYFLTEDLPDRTTDRYFEFSGSQIVSETGALTSSDLTLTGFSFSCSDKLVTIAFTLTRSDPTDIREFASVDFQGKVRLRVY